jgi:GTP-binding protein
VYGGGVFVDRIKVQAKAGDGGRGCVSFRREKFVPKGGPDGGDGGKGGDIILRADLHTDNLATLFYEPLIKAKNGQHGQGKQMHGRGAPDKIVKVPVGTVVWALNEEAQNATPQDEPLADLIRPNDEFILCRGGKGGKGNVHFKSSRNRAPREYSEGEAGEEGTFLLELRTIADVGWLATRTRQVNSSATPFGRAPEGRGVSVYHFASDDRGRGVG